jgi:hypothetical protein
MQPKAQTARRAKIAERRLGELLAQTERNKGAKGVGPSIAVTPKDHNAPPTLADLGISKNESSKAQKLAAQLEAGPVELHPG